MLPSTSFAGTSPQGRRQVVVLSSYDQATQRPNTRALVLDAEGRVVHRIPLPGLVLPAVKGRLLAGRGGDGVQRLVYAVDAARGTARLRRVSHFPFQSWVTGATGAGLLTTQRSYAFFDGRTGALLRRFRPTPAAGRVVGAPGGYLTVGSTENGDGRTVSRTLRGTLRWRRSTPCDDPRTVVLRDRVYQQCSRRDGDFSVRVLDYGTGRTLATVPGFFEFRPLARGRDDDQLPFFGSTD